MLCCIPAGDYPRYVPQYSCACLPSNDIVLYHCLFPFSTKQSYITHAPPLARHVILSWVEFIPYYVHFLNFSNYPTVSSDSFFIFLTSSQNFKRLFRQFFIFLTSQKFERLFRQIYFCFPRVQHSIFFIHPVKLPVGEIGCCSIYLLPVTTLNPASTLGCICDSALLHLAIFF